MGHEPGGTNIERLLEAGFRIKLPLPDEYRKVLEGLSDEEVSLLISMKERFDEAESQTAPEVGAYSEYFLHPPF
jgi:hypothetical protein